MASTRSASKEAADQVPEINSIDCPENVLEASPLSDRRTEINFEAESIASTIKPEHPPNANDLRFLSKESTSLERDIASMSELPPERPLASNYGLAPEDEVELDESCNVAASEIEPAALDRPLADASGQAPDQVVQGVPCAFLQTPMEPAVTLGLISDPLDLLMVPGDVLVVRGRGRLMEIGAAGGFMGHVMLVTGAPRRWDPEHEGARRLAETTFEWPADAVESWIIPSMESTRQEQGLHRSELIVYVQRSTGNLKLIGEFTKTDVVIEEDPDTIEIWQSPAELRQQLNVMIMQEVINDMKAHEANWSVSTAARAFMQIAWSSARLAPGMGTAEVLEVIHSSWQQEPICTSVVVIFWQKYLCKLAQVAIINSGNLVDPAELVLNWMPLRSDRVLPGELFTVLQSCGWVMLPQVPKVLQPVAISIPLLQPNPETFEAGEHVEYWSQRNNCWVPATVLRPHQLDEAGRVVTYDLDVKLCAEAIKIRKRAVEEPECQVIENSQSANLRSLITSGLKDGWLSIDDVIGAVKDSGALESDKAQKAWHSAAEF